MPMSWAAPLSSLTARMALPILVLLVNRVRPIMMMMQARMVTMVEPVSTALPSWMEGRKEAMSGKILGLEDQMSRAAFCRK